jgi:adenosylhomocysteinase
MNCDIRDASLAPKGKQRILWADRHMPVLTKIRKRFEKEKPLDGINLGACLHVTTETANLVRTLQAGGARVLLCASNPLSTQDDAASSLVQDFGAEVFAINGEDTKTYYDHIRSVLSPGCHITMDDGADLVSTLHSELTDHIGSVLGGTEETTTGVIRLRSMDHQCAPCGIHIRGGRLRMVRTRAC